jgi:hypothetical protein
MSYKYISLNYLLISLSLSLLSVAPLQAQVMNPKPKENNAEFGYTVKGDSVCKTTIGKKGELKQFKFVLNHTYWVEPPVQASNKFRGKDGNTNLTLKL